MRYIVATQNGIILHTVFRNPLWNIPPDYAVNEAGPVAFELSRGQMGRVVAG